MKQKSALIISFTSVTDEPRVRRQAQALMDAGWAVVVAGYSGRSPMPAGWQHIVLQSDKITISNKLYRNCLKCWRYSLYLPFIFLGRFNQKFAVFAYWRNGSVQKNLDIIKREYRSLNIPAPSLIISHDYPTAPIAESLGRVWGCPYAVDIHEYAREQYNNRRLWRFLFRPWVDRMQALYLRSSSLNTTVCDGIADLLARDYAPMSRPLVLKSVPSYVEMPFVPSSEKVTVLYHGIIYQARGLDMAIESLPLWLPHFHLVIRGPADCIYVDQLKDRARVLGVLNRVTFEEPVLFNEIIPAANKADIGYFIQPDLSAQKRFALPNKFFEYVSAGLALCIGDLPEMARITRQYDLGKLVVGYSPESIAAVINSFTLDEIDSYKKNALAAAKHLCWENEAKKMVDAYEKLILSQKT